MLTGLGKAQDRLEFLQGKAVSGDDDDMVIVSNMNIYLYLNYFRNHILVILRRRKTLQNTFY